MDVDACYREGTSPGQEYFPHLTCPHYKKALRVAFLSVWIERENEKYDTQTPSTPSTSDKAGFANPASSESDGRADEREGFRSSGNDSAHRLRFPATAQSTVLSQETERNEQNPRPSAETPSESPVMIVDATHE